MIHRLYKMVPQGYNSAHVASPKNALFRIFDLAFLLALFCFR